MPGRYHNAQVTNTSSRTPSSSPSKPRQLNARQKLFIKAYFDSSGSVKDAYERAGFTGTWETQGYDLLKRLKPHVDAERARRDAIEYAATGRAIVKAVEAKHIPTILDKPQFLAEVNARTVTREWILNELIDNVIGAKSGEKPNYNASNQALQLLGKEMGMFADKVEEPKSETSYRDIEELKERVRQRSIKLGLPIPGICQKVNE
jgi:hypothetical protein